MGICLLAIKSSDKMEFGLALNTSTLETTKVNAIIDLSNMLRDYLSKRSYGGSIDYLAIGIVIVEPEYESFFKMKRPKYYSDKKSITLDGITVELEKTLEYSVKINYNKFVQATYPREIVALEILLSLDELKLPGKVKDFDKERFKNDLEFFFTESGVIS